MNADQPLSTNAGNRGRGRFLAFGCVLVVAALVAGDRAAEAEKAANPVSAPAAPSEKLDLAYIPASAVAAVVVHPRDLLSRDEMKLLPIEIISVAGKKELGIDPLTVEQVVGLIGNVREEAPPDFGVIVRLTEPHTLDAVLPHLKDMTEPAELKSGDQTIAYRKSKEPPAPSYAMPDEQTLVIGSHDLLEQMLSAAEGDSPLLTLLAEADVSSDLTLVLAVEPVRELFKMAAADAAPWLPPELAGLLKAPELADSAEFRVDVKGKFRAELLLRGKDEDAAAELEKSLSTALEFGREQALAAMKPKGPAPTDQVEQAMVAYTNRITNMWLDELRPSREGDVVTLDVESKLSASTAGVAIALLLPKVQRVREAAASTASQNDTRQIQEAIEKFNAPPREAFPQPTPESPQSIPRGEPNP